jgi:hypothetical protein
MLWEARIPVTVEENMGYVNKHDRMAESYSVGFIKCDLR